MTKNTSWKVIPGILMNEVMGMEVKGVLMGFLEEQTVFLPFYGGLVLGPLWMPNLLLLKSFI